MLVRPLVRFSVGNAFVKFNEITQFTDYRKEQRRGRSDDKNRKKKKIKRENYLNCITDHPGLVPNRDPVFTLYRKALRGYHGFQEALKCSLELWNPIGLMKPFRGQRDVIQPTRRKINQWTNGCMDGHTGTMD